MRKMYNTKKHNHIEREYNKIRKDMYYIIFSIRDYIKNEIHKEPLSIPIYHRIDICGYLYMNIDR